MLFRTTFISTVALLCVNQAVGAAVEAPRSVDIATTACLCSPNTSQEDSILTFFMKIMRATAPTIVVIRVAPVASTIPVLATLRRLFLVVSYPS